MLEEITSIEEFTKLITKAKKPIIYLIIDKSCGVCQNIIHYPIYNSNSVAFYYSELGKNKELDFVLKLNGAPRAYSILFNNTLETIYGREITEERLLKEIKYLEETSKFPPLKVQLISFFKAIFRLFKSGFSGRKLQTARLEACNYCPHLTPANRCSACGCFVSFKASLKQEVCPKQRWP